MPDIADSTDIADIADPAAPGWFASAVVYQIYPRSFADSNGDGIGDLRGVIDRLDHLVALGVDVVWLSPVYRSPQDDNGYDISDYQDIDPVFGTLDDLDDLIAALHGQGIRLVMDLVVNHTSDDHPWFVQSRSSPDHPKRDWYWWRPARAAMPAGTPGAEPTNWQSAFSGSAWTLDEPSGEYYLHLFSPKQPDLNWENPQVRQAVHAMMRWWLDRGVDGFRMDVINMISKRVQPDGALDDGPVRGSGPWGYGGAEYFCGPRIHEFLAQMHREVFAGRDDVELLTVGEMPAVTVEQARLFTDPGRAEVDMVFQFEHMDLDHGVDKWDVKPLNLLDLKATFGRWQAGLAETGWNSLYWNNHDQPRVVSRFGNDTDYRVRSAKTLATLLHLHRGTPYVYQGEELGMTNAPFAGIDDFRDIESLNHFREAVAGGGDPEQVLTGLRLMSRDNARTPMQWDATRHAGFTSGQPWIPVNPNHVTVNAADQLADPDSVFQHYRRLIALRHQDPVVARGDFTMVLATHQTVYAFTRALDGVTLLVLANLSDEAAEVALDGEPAGELDWADAEPVLTEAHPDRRLDPAGTSPVRAGGRFGLSAWECIVLRHRG